MNPPVVDSQEANLKIVVEEPHHPLWAAHWTEMRKWWSLRCGIVGVLILSGLPALNDQFPNVAPSLISWFPHGGEQWVPILGAVLAVATRVISQAYIADKIRGVFKVKGDEPQ